MTGRIWYPQLDFYSCIRRLGGLLLVFDAPPSVERLHIVDFFLANPPLLHKCTMSRETRSAFLALGILRPEKAFLQYPAAPLLFAKMQPIQKEALRAMAGKGLVSIDMLQSEIVELTPLGNETFISNSTSEYTTDEVSLMEFLTGSFAAPTDDGISALRRSAGIRRIA